MHCHALMLLLFHCLPLPPSLFLTMNTIFSPTHGNSQGCRILTHWGILTYKATGRGSPSHAHTQRHKAHISKSKGPSLRSGSPQSFLTTTTHPHRTWAAASVSHPGASKPGGCQCRKQQGQGLLAEGRAAPGQRVCLCVSVKCEWVCKAAHRRLPCMGQF